MSGPDEAGKITLESGPYYVGDQPVGVVAVPRYGRRIVKLSVPKNSTTGEPELGRVSTCFHGNGLRPRYTAGAAKAATTDEDLCRLCVFERDRLK